MRVRHEAVGYAVIIVLSALAIAGGAQVRIAKVLIHEPGRERIVYRIFAPGRGTDGIASTIFNLTHDDFMCHLYDWYGLRELDGGFGVATR